MAPTTPGKPVFLLKPSARSLYCWLVVGQTISLPQTVSIALQTSKRTLCKVALLKPKRLATPRKDSVLPRSHNEDNIFFLIETVLAVRCGPSSRHSSCQGRNMNFNILQTFINLLRVSLFIHTALPEKKNIQSCPYVFL